jgi:fumarylacetoacetase-like protein
MRLVTYELEGTRRLGAWVDASIVDLPDAVGHPVFPVTLEALLARHGGTTLDAAREALAYHDVRQFGRPGVRLLAPVDVDRGGGRRAGPLLLGPGDRLTVARSAGELLVLPQVGLVIGSGGRNLSPSRALRCVFGHTLMLTWLTERRGRRVRVAVSLGPAVSTLDEVDPHGAPASVEVDGVIVWRGGLDLAEGVVAERIARASRHGLSPGQVVGVPVAPTLRSGLAEPRHRVQLVAAGLGSLRTWFRRAGEAASNPG